MNDSIPEELLEAGRGYEALFVPALFGPWPKHLLPAAGVGNGDHVLDIACGTGVLARAALSIVSASGRVVGVDPAPGMIGTAREIETRVEWLLGSAESLDLEDANFDAVLCQFGMMFFKDRAKAALEMHRVLKTGGRVAIAVWNTLDENPAYKDIVSLLRKEIGHAAADAVELPFTLGNPAETTSLLKDTGFLDVEVATLTESARFPSTRHMVEAELRGWLPLFDIHLEEDRIAEILAISDDALSKFTASDGQAVFPTSAHVISARK